MVFAKIFLTADVFCYCLNKEKGFIFDMVQFIDFFILWIMCFGVKPKNYLLNVSRNGAVRTPNNPLPHKNSDNTQNFQCQHFRNWKLTKGIDNLESVYSRKLAESWYEQWALWGFAFLSPMTLSSARWQPWKPVATQLCWKAAPNSLWGWENWAGSPQKPNSHINVIIWPVWKFP